ncbi:MAG: two-component sensor histidine kinase [Sphingomonadales bacterium]|nr:two-component sensor histidine kinase [Sphingomonadales bacterium]
MPDEVKRKLTRTTLIYWALLLYVLAALLWWLISLQQQNRLIALEKRQLLELRSSELSPDEYKIEQRSIDDQFERNETKYISEGITFLIVILIGAVFIYRAVRRQFKMQQQQQHFMMAVTHELKTPIAVAKLNLETLQKYQLDPEKQQKLIRTTLDETARLNFLTNNILISAQLENKAFISSKEELDLSALLLDCVAALQKRFPDRSIETEIEKEIDMVGDALLLQILINNLLENAIKYAPGLSSIRTTLHSTPIGIRLAVADQGPGVPESERSKVFDRFYRIGNEQTRTTKGTGLGLYLCQRIAQDHRGRIEIENNHPQGSIFNVIFAQ